MATRKKRLTCTEDCVIYARYSSHNQREASIEQQIAECTQHATEMGLNVISTYEDRAVSGTTDKRPNFQRMMRDAEKGKFKYVLAWKSNRIGRNMLQAMINETKLNEFGIKVYYAEEDFDDTAAGRFALRSMMNVNQFYSENMAEDITRGLLDNATKCKSNGSLPLGYVTGEDGQVEIYEPEASIVREIFTRVAAYETFSDIAADLNRRGVKTKKRAFWNKGSFHLLKNERYRGIYIYGDVRVEGGIPRIVSDDLFYRVQEVVKMKKNPQNGRHRTGSEDYLLTGKLHCGHCGGYMVGTSGTSKSGVLHYYYACQTKRQQHTCDKKNVRREVIEGAVARAIRQHLLTDEVITWMADGIMEYYDKNEQDLMIASMEDALAENKKATSNLLKAIEAGIITDTTKSRMLELETEQSRLTAKIEAARTQSFRLDRDDVVASLLLYQQGDVEDKKYQEKLFDTFLRAVYIYDDDKRPDGKTLKIIFAFPTENNEIEVSMDEKDTEIDDSTQKGECSHKLSTDPPRLTANRIGLRFFVVSAFFTKRYRAA